MADIPSQVRWMPEMKRDLFLLRDLVEATDPIGRTDHVARTDPPDPQRAPGTGGT